jgi:hypothetical protein
MMARVRFVLDEDDSSTETLGFTKGQVFSLTLSLSLSSSVRMSYQCSLLTKRASLSITMRMIITRSY